MKNKIRQISELAAAMCVLAAVVIYALFLDLGVEQ